jgi:ubiquinone/menaquinone biosynthesis C-methylase UbiE
MWTYDDIIGFLIPEVEFHQNRYGRELDMVVPPGVNWLDLGAGGRLHGGWSGVSADQIARRARTLIGCDLKVAALASNPHLTAAVGADATRLPFREKHFDIVTANMVLEHLPRPDRAFMEVARVLRPGGIFLFVTSHLGHPAVRLAALFLSPEVRSTLASHAEGRGLEHVFPTFYRSNQVSDLERLAMQAKLIPHVLEIFPSYPFIRKPMAGTILEALLLRTLRWGTLRKRFGSNLIGVFEKPPAG